MEAPSLAGLQLNSQRYHLENIPSFQNYDGMTWLYVDILIKLQDYFIWIISFFCVFDDRMSPLIAKDMIEWWDVMGISWRTGLEDGLLLWEILRLSVAEQQYIFK